MPTLARAATSPPTPVSLGSPCAGSGEIEYQELARELRRSSDAAPSTPKAAAEAAFAFVPRPRSHQFTRMRDPKLRDALEVLEQQGAELEQVRAGLKLIQGEVAEQRASPRAQQQRRREHEALIRDLLCSSTMKSRQHASIRHMQIGGMAPPPVVPAHKGNHTWRQTARF